mmetsp:Transcript_589/g.927  ORF Transcript_589/g.927 Transcript_589/m.927 type:complete len:242 (-) Transcript_589:4731-5456(-)
MVEIDNKLIMKLNFPTYEQLSHEEKLQRLMDLQTLRLEWAGIARIDNLELFNQITSLHLQFNQIQVIENLDFLTELEYLSLAGNLIQRVSGLRLLEKLLYLNLAENRIDRFDLREIPGQVALLKVKGNPGADEELRRQILIKFEMLEELDDQEVTDADRFEALGFKAKKTPNPSVPDAPAAQSSQDIRRYMTEPEDYDELTAKTAEILKHTRRRYEGQIDRKERFLKRLHLAQAKPKTDSS